MKPLDVVVCAVIDGDKILLLKRNNDPYKGHWCLPGGKIEFGEHISEAALREIKEETDLDCDFVRLDGIYTEILREKREIIATFILFMVTLKPHDTNHVESDEGELRWVPLDKLDDMKDMMIENDYMAIRKLVIEKEGFYYETEMEKISENKYTMPRFEKIN